jgi:transcriptional/translational regulatory protein YebC/TACO1
MAFLEELDDHDDVQSVASNINLSDEVAAAL